MQNSQPCCKAVKYGHFNIVWIKISEDMTENVYKIISTCCYTCCCISFCEVGQELLDDS